MDTRLTLLLLLLGVSLCLAASGVLKNQKRAANLKKRADDDLCDARGKDGSVPEWMTECDDKKTCIFTEWMCDGFEDCNDGSDETHPLCGDSDPETDLCSQIDSNGVVPYWMRICQDQATCIFAEWECDDEVDCFDGSDEKECTGELPIDLCKFAKGDEEWLKVCDSGDECILTDFMCDKEEDCKDGSDEKPSVCASIWKNLNGGYRSG